jgi:hypothetical protein
LYDQRRDVSSAGVAGVEEEIERDARHQGPEPRMRCYVKVALAGKPAPLVNADPLPRCRQRGIISTRHGRASGSSSATGGATSLWGRHRPPPGSLADHR